MLAGLANWLSRPFATLDVLLWTRCAAALLKSSLLRTPLQSLALRAASRRYSTPATLKGEGPKRRGAGRSRGTSRRASYHGSSAAAEHLLHTFVWPARRSPLAGGTRDRYALLSKADTGTLVDALVTPPTRHHAIETTDRDAHRPFTTQVRDAS